ncbi:MAG: Ig-like domain-containing protein, partial [Bryobacteraceae bacterium]
MTAVSLAQTRVDVSAPEPVIIAGEQMRLSAVMRNALGEPVLNTTFVWSSSNAQMLSVDGFGMATARRPGQVNVAAVSGTLRGQMEIQIVPLRVEVTPANAELYVGDRLAFTATAYDANQQPIDNVAYQWQVTGANGGQINAAAINASGVLTANGVARVTVRANINYNNRGGKLQAQAIGFAVARIDARRGYRRRRLLAS